MGSDMRMSPPQVGFKQEGHVRTTMVFPEQEWLRLKEQADLRGMTATSYMRLVLSIAEVLLPYLQKPGTTLILNDAGRRREIIIPRF